MSHTIGAARRALARRLRDAGIDTPDLDARLLVGHALGLEHTALAARDDRVLTQPESDAIEILARRRLAHEPVARILGKKEFWGLAFSLNADMLVPRPDTETLVEAALQHAARDRPLRIADLGTGSGALLLALLHELPLAFGVGTDVNLAATAGARANAQALGLVARTAFLVCDYGAALAGGFDLVVSNPPYIAAADIAGLESEVRDFDPHRALDGGRDGLDAYRAIAADAQRLLAPDGLMVLELGIGMEHAVASLFSGWGLTVAGRSKDLSGVARALLIRRLP